MRIAFKTIHSDCFRTLYYWSLLLITLVVVDDLTFGWIFWAISQINLLFSAATAFTVSWLVSYWLTKRGLASKPGKLASWLLARLQLERKNAELAVREERLKKQVNSVAIAIPMSLLFGGVATTLWLRRNSVVDDLQANRLAFWLCGFYGVEFALIHALGIGGGIFFARQ